MIPAQRVLPLLAGCCVVIVFVAAMVSCEQAEVNLQVDSNSELRFTVTNESNTPLSGADVSLFLNEEDFILQADPIAKGTTDAQGRIIFRNLAVAEYWFISTYIDPQRFILLNNASGTVRLAEPLAQNTVLEATLLLQPSTELNAITFWNSDVASTTNPLEVTVTQLSNSLNPEPGAPTRTANGSLAKRRSAPPLGAGDSSTLSLALNPGVYAYEASSSNGACSWVGTFTLPTFQVRATNLIALQGCSEGSVSVYALFSNPITLTLGTTDTLGVIIQRVLNVPNCNETGTFTISRPAGRYVLRARSATGLCIWERAVTLVAGQCTLIGLEQCNE
jgi:hypothetical protein